MMTDDEIPQDAFAVGSKFAYLVHCDVRILKVIAKHGDRLLCETPSGFKVILSAEYAWRHNAVPMPKRRSWWSMLFRRNPSPKE